MSSDPFSNLSGLLVPWKGFCFKFHALAWAKSSPTVRSDKRSPNLTELRNFWLRKDLRCLILPSMKSLWNETEARAMGDSPLKLRIYTSRLLGRDPNLVLAGGGNTSVKVRRTNLFGELEEVLYVKGSGWALSNIGLEGFAPVRLDVLRKMMRLKHLSDLDLVQLQRSALLDPASPNPWKPFCMRSCPSPMLTTLMPTLL